MNSTANQTAHTPGPWKVQHRSVVGANNAPVNGLVLLRMTAGNRALILAAPELLALVRAWRISEPLSGYTDTIDAVLAKAEGVQP